MSSSSSVLSSSSTPYLPSPSSSGRAASAGLVSAPPPLTLSSRSSSFRKIQKRLPTTPHGLKRFTACGVVLFTLGIIFIVAAAVTSPTLQNAVSNGLRSAVILNSPQASGFDAWKDDAANPLVMSAYVLDVANPYEVMNGATPIVIERGPYVYYEHRRNFNISWSADESTISYEQFSQYTFAPSLSVGDDSKIVTSLNMPFFALRYSLSSAELGLLVSVYKVLLQQNEQQILFVQRSVREVLFGYVDPALSTLASFGFPIQTVYPGFFNNFTTPDQAVRSGKIGMTTLRTGVNDLGNIRELLQWQGMTSLTVAPSCLSPPCPSTPLWASKAANQVRGSDGSQFTPPVSTSATLTVFFSSFYRAIPLQYITDVSYKGITLHRFQFSDSLWQNASVNPANADFYQIDTPHGMVNVSAEVQGVPSFMTNPRFINTDSSVSNAIDYAPLAFTPTLTSFDVEPYSGSTFHVTAASQFNVYITPMPNMVVPGLPNNHTTWFALVKPCYFPVFWASEEGSISDADAATFVSSVYGALFLEDLSFNLGYPFGAFFLLFGGVMFVYGLWMMKLLPFLPEPNVDDFETVPGEGENSPESSLLDGEKKKQQRQQVEREYSYTPSSKSYQYHFEEKEGIPL